jgi:tRNA (guanine37-N1)-methyltransferase
MSEARLSIQVITLFPPLFSCWLEQGVVSRAVAKGVISLKLVNLREFGIGRHKITDDYPFGGGAGMVMKPEPLFDAVESLDLQPGTPIVLASPQGQPLRQRVAEDLSHLREFVLVCGHYEGVDERVRQHLVTEEISIGDYVLSSGELAAMVIVDAVVRLVPGVLAEGSTVEESFTEGLLEYPQYTRPATYRDWSVPDVLLSGHHAQVAAWRRSEAQRTTALRRPDLLEQVEPTPQEHKRIKD